MLVFGEDYEMRYDTIVNHDVYSFLRVTLEVPRGHTDHVVVVLNGREVGKVMAHKKSARGKKVSHFTALRYRKPNVPDETTPVQGQFPALGHAAAAVISEYLLL